LDKRSYTVKYTGQGLSLNSWYSGKHWSQRQKAKNFFKEKFLILFMEAKVKFLPQFKLHLKYNSRFDLDNVVAMAKIAVDTMKGIYIKNDDKKFYKGLTIEPDETLPKDTYVFIITEV
jgi:hypothetical protein